MDNRDTKKISKAVIVNNKGKVLVLHPAAKERWHLPGGHLQHGESYLQGMKREVFEETALQVTTFFLIDAKPGFQLWLCKCSNTPVKLSSEHRAHKWSSFEDALNKINTTKETARDLKVAQEKIKRYQTWFNMPQQPKKAEKKKKSQVEIQEQ